MAVMRLSSPDLEQLLPEGEMLSIFTWATELVEFILIVGNK